MNLRGNHACVLSFHQFDSRHVQNSLVNQILCKFGNFRNERCFQLDDTKNDINNDNYLLFLFIIIY